MLNTGHRHERFSLGPIGKCKLSLDNGLALWELQVAMIELQEITVRNLLLDVENPRLAEGQQSQLETLHAMLRAEGPKTIALAESIAREGLSPMERFLVIPSEQEADRFVVLEGNRRLVALRVLAEASLADAPLTAAQQKKIGKLSAEYKKRGEVERVDCAIFPSREAANPWIERRHRGEQGGVGVVSWGGTESARFDARRSGRYRSELQVLDYAVQHAQFDNDTREKLHDFPITSLDRLIADKDVRDKLGLQIDEEGRVLTRYPEKETIKGLVRIVRDLATGRIKVGDIYTGKERRDYVAKFKSSDLPMSSKALSAPVPLIGNGGVALQPSEQPTQAKKPVPTPKLRLTLIPSTCKLTITVPKLVNIYRELRKLKLEDYPNAVSVLLRVFIELSTDEVIEKNNLMKEEELRNSKLHHKLIRAAEHLQSVGRLDEKQVKAIKKAATDKHLLYASVTTLHQYVHNQSFSAPRQIYAQHGIIFSSSSKQFGRNFPVSISRRIKEDGGTRYLSPLRYPGGKARLVDFMKSIFQTNDLLGGTYSEVYAGGAAVGLALLFAEYAANICINDSDPAVYAFWLSTLENTEGLCRLIQDRPVTPTEWDRQRRIYVNATKESTLALGFATFFLNRTNRSGIIDSGGMIGGRDQAGSWRLNARYNRPELVNRIQRIGQYRDRIHVSNLDAADFLIWAGKSLRTNSLVYLDPPYYTKGRRLYANYYEEKDHSTIAELLSSQPHHWVVSYDNVAPIRRLYHGYRSLTYKLWYTASDLQQGIEIMFFSPSLVVPRMTRTSPGSFTKRMRTSSSKY